MENQQDQPARNGLAEKIERGNLMAAQCPSRDVLSHVTSQWGTLILIVLRNGTFRFSQLRRTIGGVSERMLAKTLKDLEKDGLIDRKSYPVVPPHTEYSLTPMGQEVAEKIHDLTDWIENSMPSIARHWAGS